MSTFAAQFPTGEIPLMAGEPLAFTPRLRDRRVLSERHSHPAGSHAKTGDGHLTPPVASAPAPAPSLTIAVGRALSTVVVTVRGALTEHDVPTLRAVLNDLINDQGNLDVVIEMRRLASASASGLAALAAAARWAAERGATFRLSEPAAAMQEKLKGVGLASAIELGAHQTLDAKS